MRIPDKLRARIKAAKFYIKMKKFELIYRFKKKLNIHCGSTRAVLVTKRYAFKFPRLKSLDQFFRGLAANQKEREYSKKAPDYFVPVLFSIPGLLVVMPALKPFGENNPMVRAFMADLWHPSNDNSNRANHAWLARCYCECINENYAMYKGKPMCIDYGTYIRADVNEQDFLKEMRWLVDKLDGKFEVIDEPEQSEVQVFGKSFQMDMDLLDIPVFTANVEGKGGKLAHVVDDQQTTVEGQVPGQAVRDHHRGLLGLGNNPAPARIIQVTGRPLYHQKGIFTPTLSTVYGGNPAL